MVCHVPSAGAPPGRLLTGILGGSISDPAHGDPKRWGSARFSCLVHTRHGMTMIAPERFLPAEVPEDVRVERGFVVYGVVGPLHFSIVGVLADLSAALAAAGIPILAISSYDTDFLLVRADREADAVAALRSAGWNIEPPDRDWRDC